MRHFHLKSREHYELDYDRITVENCRKIEEDLRNQPPEYIGKRLVTSNIGDLLVGREASIRGMNKDSYVNSAMERDRRKDELLSSAITPKNIQCKSCRNPTELTYKVIKTTCTLEAGFNDNVVFIFKCPECRKCQAIRDDGTEVIPKESTCPECKQPSEMFSIEKEDASIWFYRSCNKCGFRDEHELPMSETEKEDPEFESDRKRFCYSKEKTERQHEWFRSLYEDLYRIMEKSDKKKKQKPLYDKVAAVKRPNVGELKAFLSTELVKYGYTGLTFEKPDLSKGIRVNFTVMDETGETDRYKITKAFRARLKSMLANTAWEMGNSERLQNRMGILSGQLRGIDNEDEIFNRTKMEMEKKGEPMEL